MNTKVGLRLLSAPITNTWPEANIIRNAPPDAGSDHGPGTQSKEGGGDMGLGGFGGAGPEGPPNVT